MHNPKKALIILEILLALILIAGGYLFYQYWQTSNDLALTKNNLVETDTKLKQTTEEYFNTKIELEGQIALLTDEKEEALEDLQREKDKLDDFEKEIKGITKTVGTLQKLSETDKELLQKYSKVYFLNEHYLPQDVTEIPTKYIKNKNDNNKESFHADAWEFLKDLLEESEDDGVSLRIVSALRSFGEQSQLKAGYTVVYGSGANQFSADQGYSEHQLGTALDFDTATGTPFVNFENTPEYAWLIKNAYKYGFTLSYPPDNTYYQYEPWHWRFVGRDLAEYLHDKKLNFYDVEQRKIDEYLVSIFD
jgi:D-alanyl-D-alanine carboxypeptidase